MFQPTDPSSAVAGRRIFGVTPIADTALVWRVILAGLFAVAVAWLANNAPAQPAEGADSVDVTKQGYWIDVPAGLGSSRDDERRNGADDLVRLLEQLADATREGARTTVLLRMKTDEETAATASFEDALKVARAVAGGDLRRLKVVTYIEGDLTGHRQLIALASEQLIVSSKGSLGSVKDTDGTLDEAVTLMYQSVAKRRGLVPPAIVEAMLDPDAELVQLTLVNGEQRLASGEALREIRDSGEILSEQVWKQTGEALRLPPNRLREARAISGVVNSLEEAADLLDVAELASTDTTPLLKSPRAVLVEIDGAISGNRGRRWQSNLIASLQSGEVNTWLVKIDSSGGEMDTSATLAAAFAMPDPPLQTAAGVIDGEARGDAALIALGCRPLMMTPDARLGGPGSQEIDASDIRRHDELIQKIAATTKRSPALVRGLLDSSLEVYRYTHRKTGRVRYATASEIAEEQPPDDAAFVSEWERGPRIDLGEGLSASQAVSLGLAELEVASVEAAARQIGLEAVPPTIADRPIVRWVERIGRNNSLMFLLLFIGFVTLSAEAGAPGLGIAGFISMVCFALYFWMKFLAGTAEWLELIALALGLTCIAIEIFIVPGVGIFGIGGLILTILGIVLMSQTFVIPRNSYQLEVLTRGVWIALGALAGMVGGFFAIRSLVPHVPLLNELVMEAPDAEAVDRQERMSDYRYLAGQVGVATTMLRPSGKARFGDTIVGVISDGTPLSAGDAVRVREVHGNRIVVEAVET